jgi:hypothetical protein
MTTSSPMWAFLSYSSLDYATRADSEGRPVWHALRIFILVKVGAHQERITDRRAIFNHAPNANDRPVDIRMGNDAAIGDNGLINLRPINLGGGQPGLGLRSVKKFGFTVRKRWFPLRRSI